MTRPAQPEQSNFYTDRETGHYMRLCEKQVRRLIWRGGVLPFGSALRSGSNQEDIAAFVSSRRIKPTT